MKEHRRLRLPDTPFQMRQPHCGHPLAKMAASALAVLMVLLVFDTPRTEAGAADTDDNPVCRSHLKDIVEALTQLKSIATCTAAREQLGALESAANQAAASCSSATADPLRKMAKNAKTLQATVREARSEVRDDTRCGTLVRALVKDIWSSEE